MEAQTPACDIDIANTEVPQMLGTNTRDLNITTSEKRVQVRLPENYHNTAKVMLRLGRRNAIQHVQQTDEDLIHDAERPETYDDTVRAIATADGPHVTLTGIQIECLWDAYATVRFEDLMGDEDEGHLHYIESTLLRATRALQLDALDRLPDDCRP